MANRNVKDFPATNSIDLNSSSILSVVNGELKRFTGQFTFTSTALGIGLISSPVERLQLRNGNFRMDDTVSSSFPQVNLINSASSAITQGPFILLNKLPSNNTLNANDTLGRVSFRGVGSSGGSTLECFFIDTIVASQTSSYVNGTFRISSTHNGGAVSSRFLISSDGNVSINTTSVTEKLNVNGNILLTTNAGIGFNNNISQTRINNGGGGGDNIGFYTNSTERIRLNNNGEFLVRSGSFGFGPAGQGIGGSVTQLTNKATGVTLDKICGRIVTSNATLNAATEVSFTFTNSTIAANDVVYVCIASGAVAVQGAYAVFVDQVSAGSCRISLTNLSASNLSEALTINYIVIKSSIS
jgi:hypothetical protein